VENSKKGNEAAISDASKGEVTSNENQDGTPRGIKAHIPDGYSILDTNRGDLDLDAIPDILLVLQKDPMTAADFAAEDSAAESLVRPLIILSGHSDGSFTNMGENDNVVLCRKCGGVMGDPYRSTVIKNGYFSVQHFGGSRDKWSTITTFKYSKGAGRWLLHKNGGNQVNSKDDEMVVENEWVKSEKDFGEIDFEEFDPNEENVNQ
jgi:hypothetical protein